MSAGPAGPGDPQRTVGGDRSESEAISRRQRGGVVVERDHDVGRGTAGSTWTRAFEGIPDRPVTGRADEGYPVPSLTPIFAAIGVVELPALTTTSVTSPRRRIAPATSRTSPPT